MTERIDEDASFAHSYTYTLLHERPGVPALTYFYPGARTEYGQDGLLVRFFPPNARSWIGVFAPGHVPRGKNGLYTCPDARCVCIVSGGTGYIVRVDEPTNYREVQSDIFDVRPIPAYGLLVFAGYCELTAYDANGLAWRSVRLALDELWITEVTDHHIHGKATRIDSDPIDFRVDLRTGQPNIRHPW